MSSLTGLSLTIPVAMVSDFLFRGSRFDWPYVGGSILVVLGFLVVNIDHYACFSSNISAPILSNVKTIVTDEEVITNGI